MFRSVTARACVATALAAAIALSPSFAVAQDMGLLYIEVRDRDGLPVTGLTPADFSVSEGDTEVTVVSAELVGPMKIALMVDNGHAMYEERALSSLRNGLVTFLDTLGPGHEIFLATIGRQIFRRVDFTTDREELKDSADSIFIDEGAGAVVLDGVRETWERRFEDVESFPVFVMVVSDGTESSSNYGDDDYAELVNTLVSNGITVHGVVLSTRGGSLITQVMLNLTENTGGVYEGISAATGIEEALENLANRMNDHADSVSARYRLIYEAPATRGDSISAGVRRSGVQVSLYGDIRMAR